MKFYPGDPRINRKGAPPKDKSLTALMRKYLNKKDAITGLKRKQLFIENVVKLAMEGDTTCIKYVWDRLEGKPTETKELSGKDGEPMEIIFHNGDKVTRYNLDDMIDEMQDEDEEGDCPV